MEAGLDVLLEKPMVMNVCEAKSLIGVRDRTGRTLVVAVPASLSGRIRAVVAMRERGELGRIRAVSATLWENWALPTRARGAEAEISGGGYLFDTGAHIVSTIYELVGEEFCTVSA